MKAVHLAAVGLGLLLSGCQLLGRFNANQWIGVVKGMAPRTSLTQEQLRVLTQYVQKHASDMPANQSNKI